VVRAGSWCGELRQRVEVVPPIRDDPARINDQTVRPSIDDAGLGQNVELPRRFAPPRAPRPFVAHLEHVRQQLVLLLVPDGAGEALAVDVGLGGWETAWAISRITVSIVPSAGSRTDS
jgi:hypothetical protein